MKLITKEVSNPEKKFWIWDEKITNKQDGRIYPDSTTENIKPEKILTEDSNSGYQFFDAVCKEQQIQCDTANGKSNVFSY